MKITPEQQQQLEQDMIGQVCFFCDNTAGAVAAIDVDAELFNGHERLAFPVCYRCLGASESWSLGVVEMLALSEVHKNGWT